MSRAVRLHRTVYHVMQESTVQEAAQRVPAAVTVQQVDTLQWLISLVLLHMTALLAMRGDMVLVVAQLAYALATVQPADTLP